MPFVPYGSFNQTVNSMVTLKPLGSQHALAWWRVVEHNREIWGQTSTYPEICCPNPTATAANLERDGKRFAEGTHLTLGIWVDGKLRGRLSIALDTRNRTAEISFVVDLRVRDRGIARQSAAHVIEYLFEQQGYVRVWLTCLPENTASIRTAERLGMTLEATMRNAQLINGDPHDKLLYAIVS